MDVCAHINRAQHGWRVHAAGDQVVLLIAQDWMTATQLGGYWVAPL